MNQNLTDRVGSPPILNPKGTTQKQNFPEMPEGAQEPLPYSPKKGSGNQEGPRRSQDGKYLAYEEAEVSTTTLPPANKGPALCRCLHVGTDVSK